MNMSEIGYTPGKSISRNEFTPELQNRIVDDYFGIRREQPAPAATVNPLTAQEREMLDNFKTLFSAQGVPELIEQHLKGANAQPAQPAAQPAPQFNPPVQPQQQAPQIGAGDMNAGAQAPTGQVKNPQPIPAQNPPQSSEDDLFTQLFGGSNPNAGQPAAQTGTAPVPAAAPQNEPPVQQNDPRTMNAQPQQNATGAGDNRLLEIERSVGEFNSSIRAEAIRRGLNPDSVQQKLNAMSPQEMIDAVFAQNTQQPVQPVQPAPPVNLAEQPHPTRPVQEFQGIGAPGPDVNTFRL